MSRAALWENYNDLSSIEFVELATKQAALTDYFINEQLDKFYK